MICQDTTIRLNCGCCSDVKLGCDLPADHNTPDDEHIEYRYEEGPFAEPDKCTVYTVKWRKSTLEEKQIAIENYKKWNGLDQE